VINISSDNSEAIDTVNFILAVLKQHTNELENLINELAIIDERLKKIDEVTEKIHLIADNISALKESLIKEKRYSKQED
jgi:hypothetical protein